MFVNYNQDILFKYHFKHIISMFKTFNVFPVMKKVQKLLLKKISELHNVNSYAEFQLPF